MLPTGRTRTPQGWQFDTASEQRTHSSSATALRDAFVTRLPKPACRSPRQRRRSAALHAVPEYHRVLRINCGHAPTAPGQAKLPPAPEWPVGARVLDHIKGGEIGSGHTTATALSREAQALLLPHGVILETSEETTFVGIYRTPAEFLTAASLATHPFEGLSGLPDVTRAAAFAVLTMGPAALAIERSFAAKRLVSMAVALGSEEE